MGYCGGGDISVPLQRQYRHIQNDRKRRYENNVSANVPTLYEHLYGRDVLLLYAEDNRE